MTYRFEDVLKTYCLFIPKTVIYIYESYITTVGVTEMKVFVSCVFQKG